mmetsp:Transcript_84043/g.151694  ORF Transcript_84043/g.151694 Transcript_84043/m.151694 type:complete len:264 (-) Transcript_84043:81-872(-)
MPAVNQEPIFLEVENGSGSDGFDSEVFSEGEQSSRKFTPLRVAALLAAVGLVGVVASLASSRNLEKGKTDSLIQKNNWDMTGVFTPEGTTSATSSTVLKPSENKHDGNFCGTDEEEFAGLCYMKCSILTQGTHPTRTSSFSCCAATDSTKCFIHNQQVQLKTCGGFDVSGNVNGQTSACPHQEGTCLTDEELYLGQCYKTCSLLTGGKKIHRIAFLTCCEVNTVKECLPGNPKASYSLKNNVGGGSTPESLVPHFPNKGLTEK